MAVAPEKRRAGDHPLVAAAVKPGHARGLVFGCLAALGQAGGAVISRKAHALSLAAGCSVDGGTAAYQRILGGLLVVTVAYLYSRCRVPSVVPRWEKAWPWIGANSLAGAVLGVSCYQFALGTTPSAVVLPIVALTPLIVVPFAYFTEQERPGVRSLLGSTLAVMAAAVLASHR